MLSDDALLERIQNRDAHALSDLYDRYSKLVYGLILGMLKDTDEAEDVVQDVFVLIWNKAGSWQPGLGNPKNWIVRIAHNRAVNVLRSKRLRMKQAEVPIPEEHAESGRKVLAELAEDTLWGAAVNAEESEHLARALTVLPDDQRDLIELAFFQGYSHSEIAERTSTPLGTVKTRIRTGLHTLRSSLQYLQEEQAPADFES